MLIRKTKIATMLVASLILTSLLSFTVKPGGEGFEIYLDNKLVVQRYGNNLNEVQNLQLDQRYAGKQLTIKYHHCGRVGKNRSIAIKDTKDRILKQWNFTDGKDASNAMTCNIKDILNLEKNGAGKLKLYYTSSELPKGRLLTSIEVSHSNTASL